MITHIIDNVEDFHAVLRFHGFTVEVMDDITGIRLFVKLRVVYKGKAHFATGYIEHSVIITSPGEMAMLRMLHNLLVELERGLHCGIESRVQISNSSTTVQVRLPFFSRC